MYVPHLTKLRIARITRSLPQFVVAKRARLAVRLSVLERGYDEPSGHERSAPARSVSPPSCSPS
jgi:hypothetical protein